MNKSDEILAIATREIGYHEGAGKHNKYGEWFGLDNVAWCMEFVQWVYAQANLPLPHKTPSCGALLNWYRANQPECVRDTPVKGCIVIFDFPSTNYKTDHTGIFVRKTDMKITTIDGNTSNGNDANGGWVQQRTRSLSYANPTYIIPKGLEDDMDISKLTKAECYEIMQKANEYAATLPTPEWMKSELDEAVAAGITNGERPLALCTRGEAALMCKRAAQK